MEKTELITAKDFCVYNNVSYTFISSLHEAGLVKLVTIEEEQFVDSEQILQLEKLARLHRDLDIDMEALETIARLLQRVDELEQEVKVLSSLHR